MNLHRRIEMNKNKNGLGTLYPVQIAWPAFPFGTGTGGRGLGDATTAAAPDPWTAVLASVVGQVAKAGISIGTTAATDKINQMNTDFTNQMTQLASAATGTPAASITPDQLAAYAAQNQAQTQATLAAAAAANQVALANQAAASSNTLMYVGIGAGVLLVGGLIAVLALKSPSKA